MHVSSLVRRICGNCAGKVEGQSLWKLLPCVLLMHLGVSQELLLQALGVCSACKELQPAQALCQETGNGKDLWVPCNVFYVVWVSYSQVIHRRKQTANIMQQQETSGQAYPNWR